MSFPNTLPKFPYGAVYFRKTNPPKPDWDRDYGTASEDGMNIFRHWFLWNAVEIEPGVYDWSDYDGQLDLAALGVRLAQDRWIEPGVRWDEPP